MSLIIRKQKEASILRRHPWIFSGAVKTITSAYEDGDIVEVLNEKGRFLAKGHYQNGTITVRVLSFLEEEEIDSDFWKRRVELAVKLREKAGLFDNKNSICRLVHGEGDNLPGLIIDWFNGVAVIQCHSIGMYKVQDQISSALQTVFGDRLQAVYTKSADTLPARVNATNEYLFGTAQTPHTAYEYGHAFHIDWINGQKTGFFVDQRENRALLAKYARGKKVLNTFCYSGGFSITALATGAELVHSLDSSKKAIALTEDNVSLNKLEERHKSIVADAMNYMKELEEDYDIMVLDPPAFAKHRDARHKAVQGYKRLNAHAMRQIKSGGILFTFSCSQVVDKQLFTNTIIAAAIESGRNVRILEQLHQPADHPISAFHPEGEYLKGLVVEVL
ncbi:class I SAM-dependent rRNA methyltransferase [Wandonia haliotis]|uniref:Class I SAM-dependent rRNA methyltransferase n=1 Tax=Wandonia haliotis TaxID=574963 RepID=A0ABP3Y1B6_9FLAO